MFYYFVATFFMLHILFSLFCVLLRCIYFCFIVNLHLAIETIPDLHVPQSVKACC